MMKVFLERKKIFLSPNTVLRYMQELKIHSIRKPRKTRYHKGEQYKKFYNLLKQDFTAKKPNEKWCTDFTYLYLSDGVKRYNWSIIDLYDKSIVATLNEKRIDATLAIDTLKIAFQKNKANEDLILHSDQGSQFTLKDFTEYCEKEYIRQSMSKSGCSYDR